MELDAEDLQRVVSFLEGLNEVTNSTGIDFMEAEIMLEGDTLGKVSFGPNGKYTFTGQ